LQTFTNSLTSFLHLPSFAQQYVTRAASTLRNGLKEPAKSQAMKNETFSYNAAIWEAGKPGVKKAVETLSAAGRSV